MRPSNLSNEVLLEGVLLAPVVITFTGVRLVVFPHWPGWPWLAGSVAGFVLVRAALLGPRSQQSFGRTLVAVLLRVVLAVAGFTAFLLAALTGAPHGFGAIRMTAPFIAGLLLVMFAVSRSYKWLNFKNPGKPEAP